MKFRRIWAISLMMLVSLAAVAQRPDVRFQGNVIFARVMDADTQDPVPFATVYVSKDGTTKEAFYALTNENGLVMIDKLPVGEFILKVELLGFKPLEQKIVVKEGMNRIGTLQMKPDIEQLEHAVVSAVGNPIVVKKDTIEYTASSFKTTENDMLESLLKKLPGVEISSNGKITVHGEEITKITIDGKTFFLDDPQLALKNIPASIVDKVKVLERKSEQARFTGIDDGESETVIDLSVRPGMMHGWFGNVGAGGGMDLNPKSGSKNAARYEGAALIAKFTEESQLSFIANGNNTNNRGFDDLAGDMMETMKASIGSSLMGHGSSNDGVTTSWLGGVNGSGIFLDGNFELQGNYLYNGADKYFWQKSQKTSFLPGDVNLISNNETRKNTFTQGHRVGLEMDYKVSDKTSFWFRPQFSYNYGQFNESSLFDSYRQNGGNSGAEGEMEEDLQDRLDRKIVNNGRNTSSGYNDSWNTDGRFLYRQKLGSTPGRTLSLNVRYKVSESWMDAVNKSVTHTAFDESGAVTDSTSIDQKYKLDQNTYSVAGKLAYTEPLGKNYFLQASYRYSWQESSSLKNSLDYNPLSGSYDQQNFLYSTNFKNTFLNQNIGLEFFKQEPKFTVQAGVSAQPFTTISEQRIAPRNPGEQGEMKMTRMSGWNFSPSARFEYKFSQTQYLRIRYMGWTRQPSINQLQPVPDNTNPLYIKLGNANLKPEFNQFLVARYRMSNMKSFLTLQASARFMYTKDAIINASWYNNAGVQYSAPINSEKGKFGAYMRFMINSPFGRSGFSVNSYTDLNVSSGMNYTGVGETTLVEEIMKDLISGRTTTLSVSERLQFTYRNNFIEATLGGRAQYKNAWYTEKSQAKPSTWSNRVDASITATLPWGMDIKTNVDYNFYIGYIDGYGDAQVIWNAEISQMLFKKKASITLKVYDLLNQARNVYRVNSDNYMQDVVNNTLGRYFTVSFIYRFGKADPNKYAGKGMSSYGSGHGHGYGKFGR